LIIFWSAIAMTVVANVAYVLCSKTTASAAHPLAVLSVTYAVALAACLVLYPLLAPNPHLFAELKRVNASSLLLGLAIVLLETGFILAFRSGWSVAYAALFSNAAAAVLLVPISVLVFKGRFGISNAVGMAATVAGLWLMAR
jgi:hypothetical protein